MMDMKCKMSMLWNWNAEGSCFIAESWYANTRGKFAGSCIGVFLMVFAEQWLHRVHKQYVDSITQRRRTQYLINKLNGTSTSATAATGDCCNSNTNSDSETYANEPYIKTVLMPIIEVLKHSWYWQKLPGEVYPNLLDHVLLSLLYMVQFTFAYLIMLLFMYFNGYIIICCMLGALFGHYLFRYEPICNGGCGSAVNEFEHTDARKCCM
ncbi:unnamed protein product [Ambrosiozyma monospora]|uniref:Unnamed protein product n=1 Tax=Ambrosiozyma monospora TaxID=43982 RepID=A0ACB5SYJ7_AMBMO|nr:unnamed protein product [Ambrosiozyma monospora]